MQMQDLIDDFQFNLTTNNKWQPWGVLVGHIQLDKKYIHHALP
jgi:hypothetical protein